MVSVGIDTSLTKTRRTRSADCICMDKRARISPLWEIVYHSDMCIVYLAVRETEYFTEILRNIPRMREQWCPGRFSLPRKKRPGNEAKLHVEQLFSIEVNSACKHKDHTATWKIKLTLANMVFPVPGGPYMRTLRYTPPLTLVLTVDRANARSLSSNGG